MKSDDGTGHIEEALRGYFERSGLSRKLNRASVVVEWDELVGPEIAKVTEPEGITDDGTLFVRVASAAWRQELQLMSPEIIRQLGLRGKKIRQIRWRAG